MSQNEPSILNVFIDYTDIIHQVTRFVNRVTIDIQNLVWYSKAR